MVSDLTKSEIKLKHDAMTNGVFLYPDKYNTGCDETIPLTKIQIDEVIDDVVFSLQLSGTGIGVNGWKGDSQIPHDAVIENYDFSDYTLYSGNQQKLTEEKTITFKNCKFKGVRNDPRSENGMKIKLVFDHCTFTGGVSETNITLYRCYIKEVYGDAMNPLRNFTFEESYVENLLPEADKKGTHVDGTQTYGRDYLTGDNIVFKNSRMEIPNFYFEYYEPGITYSAVNACLMFQLEYNDVNNVTYENMKLN